MRGHARRSPEPPIRMTGKATSDDPNRDPSQPPAPDRRLRRPRSYPAAVISHLEELDALHGTACDVYDGATTELDAARHVLQEAARKLRGRGRLGTGRHRDARGGHYGGAGQGGRWCPADRQRIRAGGGAVTAALEACGTAAKAVLGGFKAAVDAFVRGTAAPEPPAYVEWAFRLSAELQSLLTARTPHRPRRGSPRPGPFSAPSTGTPTITGLPWSRSPTS